MKVLVLAMIILAVACKRQEAPQPPPPSAAPGDAARGRLLIDQFSCSACHVIPGIQGARGMIGPSLEHIGSQTTIAAKHENTPATMAKWIQNPQSFDPANTMPALGINDADARDIAAYLFTLK